MGNKAIPTATAAPAAAPAPAETVMPTSGGCWIRQADGTLVRDPDVPVHDGAAPTAGDAAPKE